MKFIKKLTCILPPYAYIPLTVAVIFRFSHYFFTKLITENRVHYDLSLPIDEAIPFVPFFILFYILSYAQWFFSYVYHAHSGKESCFKILTSDIISNILCMICFLALPTSIVRPTVENNSIWHILTNMIYRLDTPVNLFPSMHCMSSWLCFKGSLLMKKAPRWYSWVQLVFTFFVFASTVFVKQHFFIDIIAGVLFVEIGWAISKHFSIWKVFDRISYRIKL